MSDWTSLMNGLNAGALAAFGREVLYLPETSGQYPIQAIVEAAHQKEENSPGTFTILFVRAADLPPGAPARGDVVEIDSVLYKIFEIEADGQGGVRLGLHFS